MPSPEPKTQEPVPERVSARLYDARTVLVFGEIDAPLARSVTAQLLSLDAQSDAPIRVLVNSPGGHVESGDSIHDVLRFVRSKVIMIGTGCVASAGALIYAAAEKQSRVALPNTRFMLHQPLGGYGGPAADIAIATRQILAARDRLNRIFADATGRPLEVIAKETERDLWLSAREAIEYGLVSRIVERVGDVA